MTELPIIARARAHGSSVAFQSKAGSHTYQDLLDRSAQLAAALLGDSDDLQEARVALLVPAGFEYVAAQWAIWRAGGIKVPICLSATEPEWEYSLSDSGASIVMTDAAMAPKIAPLCQRLGVRLLNVDLVTVVPAKKLPEISPDRRAMILYTSGTTSKPKGVVTTHANIQAQIESLVTAWEWSAADRIPLFLPMHHIHGIINITSCALWSGARIEAFERFDLAAILARVRVDAYTLFMAVPTIYVKLIQALEAASAEDRAAFVAGFKKMRLMVSGSAALPASVHEQWTELTGQKLLERYGMTEIGMALSNPFYGERRPGAVGIALPGVEARLKSESGALVTREDEPGEIQVRGPGVFRAYWNRPEASAESFDNGWFRTGDMAVIERGYYRIMGRLSVDIIKSGGYKLSALEIEAALLEHPDIRECAVIGLPDDTWGEAVTAVVVLKENPSLELPALREWSKGRLSVYKIPQRLLVVAELPRNAMGKVQKKLLAGQPAPMAAGTLAAGQPLMGEDQPVDRLVALCHALISERGESSGCELAREVTERYASLDEPGRRIFFTRLVTEFSPQPEVVATHADAYRSEPTQPNLVRLLQAVEPPRQELFRRINLAPTGTRTLLEMRAFILREITREPQWHGLDADLTHLLRSWFNRGFLEMRRVDWRTSALVLEKLIQYEAVHEIHGWHDLRRRLQADRRCFAFFHPVLPDEPIIFIEVALTTELSAQIRPLLDPDSPVADPEAATHAIFYSITNCQPGLRGISFGHFLIKQVAQDLAREFRSIAKFATLSPVPRFGEWLRDHVPAGSAAEDDAALCAHYLLHVKRGMEAHDPVARFHLGNGARLERINPQRDAPGTGRRPSRAVMVNYLYELESIERNHEAYARHGTIACSPEVAAIAAAAAAI